MTLKVLVIYPQKCTGCRICEQWCAWSHHQVVSPARSRITIHRLSQRYLNVPVACSQCAKAPCIEVCPEAAIRRDQATGGLILDPDSCIGCRLCVESCPRGCIKIEAETGIPLLCDLCDGNPQCVKHCPEGAIRYLQPDKIDRGYREIHVARLAGVKEGR